MEGGDGREHLARLLALLGLLHHRRRLWQPLRAQRHVRRVHAGLGRWRLVVFVLVNRRSVVGLSGIYLFFYTKNMLIRITAAIAMY